MNDKNNDSVNQRQVCRGCMLTDDFSKSTSISMCSIEDQVKEMFIFCTGIQINKDDGLPYKICEKCIKNVNYCFEFINTCKKTDELLKCNFPLGFIKTDTKVSNNAVFIKRELNTDDEYCSDNAALCDVNGEDEIKVENENQFMAINKNSDSSNASFSSKDNNLKKKKSSNKINKFYYNQDKTSLKSIKKQKDKKYVCDYCSKIFTRAQNLATHLVIHSGNKPYICDKCPKAYKQLSQLIIHTRSHSNERPFKCENCVLRFPSKAALVNHSKHHEEDTHLCDLCGQKFTQLGNLRVHMRTHTGEKPYACSVCPFRCSVQSGMRRHELIHSNIKNFTCPICNKSFNTSGVLIRHKRIHTGEKPFVCSYCSKGFIDSWKRKKHLITAHNVLLSDMPHTVTGRKRTYEKIVTREEMPNVKSENMKHNT